MAQETWEESRGVVLMGLKSLEERYLDLNKRVLDLQIKTLEGIGNIERNQDKMEATFSEKFNRFQMLAGSLQIIVVGVIVFLIQQVLTK